MEKKQKGRLILKSIPTKKVEEDVVNYLATLFKKYPRQKISGLVQKAPVTLSSRIPSEKGKPIAARLRELGAIAVFTTQNLTVESVRPSPVNPKPQQNAPSPTGNAIKVPIIPPPPKKSGLMRWALGLTSILILVGAATFGYLAFFKQEKPLPKPTQLQPAQVISKTESPKSGYSDFKQLSH